jgi:hypothetical protein
VKYPAPDQGGPAAATASRHRPVPGEREATEPSGSRVGQSPGEETGRRLPRRAVPASSPDPRFPHGPLAVLEGDGVAHGSGGIVLDCPAATVAELAQWASTESGLGASRLHRYGKDADPLIMLTAAAAVKLGLPEHLEGHDKRRGHLPQDHSVVQELGKAGWHLTRRGFGPWTRVSRTVDGACAWQSCRGTPSPAGRASPGWTRPASPWLSASMRSG